MGQKVICHGHSLLDDLVGNISYFQLLVLNATGRLPDERLAKWLEASYMCLSWPDPRIWCNQIGSLAGSTQTSPVAAASAGILASDSHLYGPGVIPDVVSFIIQALKDFKSGKSIQEIVAGYARRPGTKPKIPGYNRPILSSDERVPAMERVTKELEFSRGEHLSLAYEIEKHLLDQYKEGMSIAIYFLAFLCDQNFSLQEIYRILSIMVASGVTACYTEALENPPESFLPLRCDDIEYKGPEKRPVPDSN